MPAQDSAKTRVFPGFSRIVRIAWRVAAGKTRRENIAAVNAVFIAPGGNRRMRILIAAR